MSLNIMSPMNSLVDCASYYLAASDTTYEFAL